MEHGKRKADIEIINGVAIDWSKFKGMYPVKSREKYIDLCVKLNELGATLSSDYIGEKSPVSFIIDDIQVDLASVSNFKRGFYGAIKGFKDALKLNGDKFIRFIGRDNKGQLIAEVNTFDGGVLNISTFNYGQFCKGRENLYNNTSMVGIKLHSAYINPSNDIDYSIDKAFFYNRRIRDIRKTIDSIVEFKNNVELEGDEFIEFSRVEKGKLYANIRENRFNKIIEVQVSLYNYNSQGFLRAREECYKKEKELGIELLEPYTKISDKIYMLMKCGCIVNTSPASAMKGSSNCRECSIAKSGKDNPNWRGGITELKVYLRERTKEWKKESFESTNYKCAITDERAEEVHHLYSFNSIVDDVLNELSLERHENIKDYSEEELSSLEKLFMKKHNSMLGIPLTKKMHREFHNMYKFGFNTPEQFEEFKRIKLSEIELCQSN